MTSGRGWNQLAMSATMSVGTQTKPPDHDGDTAMATKAGDHIVVPSDKVGIPERRGEILEVFAHQTGLEYRVRWDDGHESSIRPHGGNARIERHGKKRA
jgi:hypothetical protein